MIFQEDFEQTRSLEQASTSRNFYTSIQKKHPVVLSQRVFFMIHSILVLFY